MNAKERRAYWRKTERQRLKLERKYAGLIAGALHDQASSFIQAVEQGGPQAINAMDLTVWDQQLMQVYSDMFRETFMQAARATYNTMLKSEKAIGIQRIMKFVGMGVADEWTLFVNDWLRTYGLQLVVTITGNSKDLYLRIANDAIQEGIAQGLGAREIARLITERLEDQNYTYERYRALRIARTETNRASNEGHMKGAKSLPFTVDKVWISAKDGRTRRIPDDEWDHWDLDGAQVDYDAPFKAVSREGTEIEVRMAGDIEAPAGFTINCRCRTAFEGKRDAEGNLILKPEDQLITPVQRQR
jgi:hypothetical protein